MHKIFLILSMSCFFGCQNNSSLNKIKYGKFFIQGDVTIHDKDTTLNGKIDFYDSSGSLRFSQFYKNGFLDGMGKEFYKNGKIRQVVNYKCGVQNGLLTDYDINGRISISSNYFYGLRAGPQVSYVDDDPLEFKFGSLENITLYKCRYINDSTIIEDGSLLNYLTKYIKKNNSLKIDLFIYIIEPPHKMLTYKIFDKNIETGDSSIVQELNWKNGFFSEVSLDTLLQKHKYFLTIEAYYPKQKKTFYNVLKEEKRELYIPTIDSLD